jgi:F-type H+-transporting ATPase subunit b
MDDILRQLEVLFVGSVPTVILFLILLLCYTVLLHRPLKRTLAQRRERTAGAVEKAHAAMAIAEAKTQEYEARLRAARHDLVVERERQVARWNTAREATLAEARDAASARVRAARNAVAAEADRSRASLESAADELATQVLGRILPGKARTEAHS